MKIKETIERECCQTKDLLPIVPVDSSPLVVGGVWLFSFCKYCGRHFKLAHAMDSSGNGSNEVWIALPWPCGRED